METAIALFSVTFCAVAYASVQGARCDDGIKWEMATKGIQEWFSEPGNHALFARKNKATPSKLHYWAQSSLDWPSDCNVSPDGHYIFCIQKTGSGDNCAALFERHTNGRITTVDSKTTGELFSDDAWDYFQKSTGFGTTLYHAGVEFVAWGADHHCVEFSLRGHDCYEDYYISEWVMHFNIYTRKFFIAQGQKAKNRGAIAYISHKVS